MHTPQHATGRRARRTLPLLLAIASLAFVAGCEGTTWQAMDRTTAGQPVARANCVVHYKINRHGYSDTVNGTFRYDFTFLLRTRLNVMGQRSGTRWVFDGYTNDTYDTTAGRTYARNSGVLIEYRNKPLNAHAWSRPLPAEGPAYRGGVVWFDMTRLGAYVDRKSASVTQMRPLAIGLVDHELAHQYGLADAYDLGSVNREVFSNAGKMRSMTQPFTSGELGALQSQSGC